jgi:predicted ATPase
MATSQDIAQAIESISKKWENPPARNGFYGNVLKSVQIANLRSMDVCIELSWPVCAIGGVNGSGKSTVLQVCSAAYTQEKGGRYYKIGDWVRAALPGETPAVGSAAAVSFTFWDNTPGYQVPHTPARRRWQYPAKAPLRRVEFIGIAAFAPRIERRGRIHAFRSRLEVQKTTEIAAPIIQSISRIIGHSYEAGQVHTVGSAKAKWSDTLPQIKRFGTSYTEPHMGAGEQKIVRLVQTLEAIPERALILLEEPEITLHPDAQKGLAWYLMALSARKGHQIIIATHSSDIFDTLPQEARILLVRSGGIVEALHKVPYLRAARELSRTVRSNKALVLVEDEVAKAFLEEMLRRHNRSLFDNACVVPVGNTDDVSRMVKSLRTQGVKVIGVRDPDIGANEEAGLLSLPGDKAPEELLLSDNNIREAEGVLSGITDAFNRAKATGLGLEGSKWAKKVFTALPGEIAASREFLSDRLTLAWLSRHEADARGLVTQIGKALEGD